jgi:lysozyme family protein
VTRLTRDTFLQQFSGKSIDLAELKKDTSIPAEVRAQIEKADANGNGKIAGRRELDRLFTCLDELDRDGSYHSLDVGKENAPTPLGRTLAALASVAVDQPARGAAKSVTDLVAQHPELRTNQDLINHFLAGANGDWARAARVAMRFGVNLDQIVKERDAAISTEAPVLRQSGNLARLVKENPTIKTNQDLVNHFMRASANDWGRSERLAQKYGVDLGELAQHREAPVRRPSEPNPTAGGLSETTAGPRSNETEAPPPPPVSNTGSAGDGSVITFGPSASRVEPDGALRQPFLDNERDAGRMELRVTRNQERDVQAFMRTYAQNRERYETVSRATGIPPELIAAIHYRESSMNFGTYLHQGDPLGRPAVHHPSDIPVFTRWEDAAIHALQQKDGVRRALGITADTTDAAALATFAERYNGLGYHNRGLASPYAWSGTNIYQGGRYVRDGVFDASSWDQRPGVIALMTALQGGQFNQGEANQTADAAWAQVLKGNDLLRRGERSEAVTALQGMLEGLGYPVEPTGELDRATLAAVKAFQEANDLEPDGVVGPDTARAITEAFQAL